MAKKNPNGLLSIINTKLLKVSVCANKIMENATQQRAGVGTYDNARLITEIIDDVMKIDLHNLRKELEQQAEARVTHEGKALRPELDLPESKGEAGKNYRFDVKRGK